MTATHVIVREPEKAPVDAQVLPLACRHCGEQLSLIIPLTIPTFLAVAEAFTRTHRECKKAP